jgi:hypothetical protein
MRFSVIASGVLAIQLLVPAAKLVNDNCINEGTKPMVLLAMQNSQFKDSVMTVVKSSLEAISYCVKVIPDDGLDVEVMENYKAAIIVNTCRFGSIGGTAAKFVKKLSQKEKKRVLLFTTGKDKWLPKNVDVDCVSSASRLVNALSAADSIVAKTKAILNGK